MPSIPTSPTSRRSSRGGQRSRPSTLDLSSTSTSSPFVSNDFSPALSRQTSRSSVGQSPVTPRQQHHSRRKEAGGSISMSSDGLPSFVEEETGGGGGLGNLADELADAWDEDAEGQNSSYFEQDALSPNGVAGGNDMRINDMHDFGQVLSPVIQDSRYQRDRLAPAGRQVPKRTGRKVSHHQRTQSTASAYDGSDYGDTSDLESDDGISPSLAARISDIEALVRLGKGDTGLDTDEIIPRTIASLRDLGSQSSIENGTSRLMTAQASITSHLSHQTRTIQTLTHSIIGANNPFAFSSMGNDTSALDEITSMIEEIIPTLPFPPQPSPLLSLQILISSTLEVTHILRSLSDALHESRLVTNTASRRLKTVKEMVSDRRKEEDEREEGVAWIERGNWDEKLRNREAKRICGDVVTGFENTCETWRERLISQLGTAAAG